MTTTPHTLAGADAGRLNPRRFLGERWFSSLRAFTRKRPLGAASLAIIVVFALAAALAPIVAPYGMTERDSRAVLQAPTAAHPMGTDQLGRDTLSRIIYGARLSLTIGLAVAAASSVLGVIAGVSAAYFKGTTDRVITMLLDAMMAFPGLILAIALVTALGRSVPNVILAVLLPFAARVARVVRANALTVQAMPFVEAAQSIGCGHMRILLQHLVPNVMATVIVLASLNFAGAMLTEGSLSFLGLGPPPPTPSWGRMLSDEGQQFFSRAPWLGIWPGVVLAVAVYAFNLLGDALRDHLDPRLRER